MTCRKELDGRGRFALGQRALRSQRLVGSGELSDKTWKASVGAQSGAVNGSLTVDPKNLGVGIGYGKPDGLSVNVNGTFGTTDGQTSFTAGVSSPLP